MQQIQKEGKKNIPSERVHIYLELSNTSIIPLFQAIHPEDSISFLEFKVSIYEEVVT
jgi:hypothetical protein